MPIKTSLSQMEWIKEIWNMLAFKLKIPNQQANIIFQEIQTRYTESHRTYHTMIHIYQLFMLMENHPDEIEDLELMELSILFHDLIYDPQRNDNEVQSAQRADELVGQYLSAVSRHKLKLMIESTHLHKPILASEDNKIFLDMDLSILGVSPNIYAGYLRKIRQEYSILPTRQFDEGRKEFLINFLKRPRIYFTEMYYEQFEEQARKNMEREIMSL